jgi:nicotinamide-nucleotide amidase
MPDAEIIAVGSELLTPDKIDTNSLFLTEQLNLLGIEVVRKSVLGDDRRRLAAAVRGASAEVVVLCGGLGPTEDDLTREAVADALERDLVFSDSVCREIEARFRRFRRVMAERNRRQAYVISGADVLANPRGTAPGQWIENGDRVVMLLPGPPGELKPLFADVCVPRLRQKYPPVAIRTRFWRVAGMGESTLDELIAPVYTRYTNPVTTILAGGGDIQIHLRARCATAEEAERLLDEVTAHLEPLLGDRLYSRHGEPIEVVAGHLLRERGETVSVAESCTGGMLGARVTAVPGSSDYFRGGFLVYTDAMKTELLGIPPEVLEKHTAVSEAVACELAARARAKAGTSWGVSVTGYAGPDGGTAENPTGTVFIGVAGADDVEARRFQFPPTNRELVRTFAAHTALDLLRRRILRIGSSGLFFSRPS